MNNKVSYTAWLNVFDLAASRGMVKGIKTIKFPLIMINSNNISFNSSHPSADCSRHSNVPFLFPVPTVLVTKYKGFLCNLFLLWEKKRSFIFWALGHDELRRQQQPDYR